MEREGQGTTHFAEMTPISVWSTSVAGGGRHISQALLICMAHVYGHALESPRSYATGHAVATVSRRCLAGVVSNCRATAVGNAIGRPVGRLANT